MTTNETNPNIYKGFWVRGNVGFERWEHAKTNQAIWCLWGPVASLSHCGAVMLAEGSKCLVEDGEDGRHWLR
ncbi:hypothetical protein PAXRUDRAFT_823442 [Paxillus rubicundulus Ve08.2h10]|uniref:Unplaced genomic scaffold scaffold_57, whole genome shotgun sequence n=1 Tax=Paxillus rubicundulus Ve08.2h10 TaxID=930991 RepID=A0A0D0DK19_9AGAM|nr:hypothetical protein PAXRUDRAFT_823442 [Paxillus rubicundulus Ve08.2h10]